MLWLLEAILQEYKYIEEIQVKVHEAQVKQKLWSVPQISIVKLLFEIDEKYRRSVMISAPHK